MHSRRFSAVPIALTRTSRFPCLFQSARRICSEPRRQVRHTPDTLSLHLEWEERFQAFTNLLSFFSVLSINVEENQLDVGRSTGSQVAELCKIRREIRCVLHHEQGVKKLQSQKTCFTKPKLSHGTRKPFASLHQII